MLRDTSKPPVEVIQKFAKDHHIYYSLTLYNPEQNTDKIEARFSESRTQAILDGPSKNYSVCIARLNVPSTSIPVLDGISTRGFSVTLSWSGSDFQSAVGNNPPSNIPSEQGMVFSFQMFCHAINEAFASSYQALMTAFPLFPGTEQPMLIWNPDGEYFYIRVPADWPLWTDPTGYTIFFSHQLAEILQGFPYFFTVPFGSNPNGKDAALQIAEDTGDNFITYRGNDYFKFPQNNGPSTGPMFDISSVAVISNGLNISFQMQSNPLFQGQQVSLNIVTDFEPVFGGGGGLIDTACSSPLQLNPNFLRMIPLQGDGPIYNMDLSFWRLNRNNQASIIYLNPGEHLSCLVCFIENGLSN